MSDRLANVKEAKKIYVMNKDDLVKEETAVLDSLIELKEDLLYKNGEERLRNINKNSIGVKELTKIWIR